MPSKIEEVLHRVVGPVFRGPGDDDVVAVDTETYYDGGYGLTDMGTYSYITDPRFDPYLISVVAKDLEYVGPLKDCPWEKITGRPWVAHNMSFDAQVLIEAQKRGWIPDWVQPATLDCTADLAVFLKAPRNLAGAVRELFGKTMEKETRDLMKGKTWDDAVAAGLKDQLLAYALNDARYCYDIAREHGKKWLEQEIRISRLNRKAGSIGVHVNLEAVRQAIRSLQHSIYIAGDSIPWEWGGPKQNKTPLSLDKAREQCRLDGIPCPTTFKEDSEEASEWEEAYAGTYPWIKAIRHWRKANRVLKLLKSLEGRTRPDGTMPYLIKYFGAHTGRFSGGDGVNMQNLPKYPFEQHAVLEGEDESFLREIDVRPMFIAPPGSVLFIADLSQIEARVLLHLAGDKRQLEAVRSGFNVYEAHARTTMNWTGGPLKAERSDLYALAKARVLGLGYGCGKAKFQSVAKIMANVDLSREQAETTVDAYRESNPLICDLWARLNAGLKSSATRHENFKMTTPSGRCLEYFKPHFEGRELKAQVERGGTFYKFWGGVLTENLCQAFARDVFTYGLLLAEEKNLASLAFHVHDEGIWQGDEQDAEDVLHEIERCMSTPPPWAEDLPLGADGIVSNYYRKPD
jgi:hypothetical protein